MSTLYSWISIDPKSDFSIYNLPFGIFSTPVIAHRAGIALGDFVIDLHKMQELGYLDALELPKGIFEYKTLNPLLKFGKAKIQALRLRVQEIFSTDSALKGNKEHLEDVLIRQKQVRMLLPVEIGDYTDFYSSIEHATNVGTMFRDPANALLPNWRHLPVGYHGRSSSIVISGTSVYRPKGQQRPNDTEPPVFGPTKQLDFELEMAFITFDGKPLGKSISTAEAEDYIFGMLLFNDWSARDIQKWEYVPLGPFLAKNFASSVSPWIVTLDALEPFRVEGPKQEPEVFDYLKYEGKKNLDINLEVYIQSETKALARVCRSNYKFMYWNMCQQLAHHTVNGCNVRGGDLMASGTISGSAPDSYGSMLELTWKGTKPIELSDGSIRKFIEDGDTVIMKAFAVAGEVRVGFGEVRGTVLPAI